MADDAKGFGLSAVIPVVDQADHEAAYKEIIENMTPEQVAAQERLFEAAHDIARGCLAHMPPDITITVLMLAITDVVKTLADADKGQALEMVISEMVGLKGYLKV